MLLKSFLKQLQSILHIVVILLQFLVCICPTHDHWRVHLFEDILCTLIPEMEVMTVEVFIDFGPDSQILGVPVIRHSSTIAEIPQYRMTLIQVVNLAIFDLLDSWNLSIRINQEVGFRFVLKAPHGYKMHFMGEASCVCEAHD